MIDTRNAHLAANAILQDLPDNISIDKGLYTAINPDHAQDLADYLQLVIAIVLSSIIDAGSEREVTLEDDDLSTAILNAVKEWIPDESS